MTRLEEMKVLATEEATNLKTHATTQEISKLNSLKINPSVSNCCIYGQMTGHCSSARANKLISLCCTKVYKVVEGGSVAEDSIIKNCVPKKTGHDPRHCYYQSPIEVLIYDENGGSVAQQKIIAFLKDETQTLEL